MSLAQEIDSYLTQSLDEMVDLQARLTAIPALSPENGGQGEWRKAKELKRILEKMNLGPIEEFSAPDARVPEQSRPNFVIKRAGRGNKSTLWIVSHLDIVPEGDLKSWNSPPFEMKRNNGKLIGRGVEDNQQGMVASIFAFKAIQDLQIPPHRNIGCIFVSDEETGSLYGVQHLLQNHADLFTKNDLFLVPDSGNADGTLIEVAEKSVLWVRVTTVGKQCHASRPYKGKNAFAAASELAAKVYDLYKVYPERDELFDPPHSTFEPTKKEGNVPNINTVPGRDVFYIDCRVMPGIPLDDVLDWLREQASAVSVKHGVGIEFETIQYVLAPKPTSKDSALVKGLVYAIREVYRHEGKPMGIGGGTVAAHFRKKGYQAVVWSRVDEVAHQPNEYCCLENLCGDAKVFARLFATL